MKCPTSTCVTAEVLVRVNYQGAINGLGQTFRETPLEFTMEADLQARLVELLRNEGTKDVPVDLQWDKENVANYKTPHVQKLADNPGRISRIHPEINTTDKDKSANKQLDVGVFNSDEVSVDWNDGSKRYMISDLDGAIELKYVKNKNVFPNNFSADELRELKGDDEAIKTANGQLKKASNSIQDDLDTLDDFAEHGVNTYLLIFSNYNYMYQGAIRDKEGERQDRNKILGRVISGWLEDYSTDVFYAHPAGQGWFGSDF
jgi:hypothetical protein